MNNVVLSICIPTYNGGVNLKRGLDILIKEVCHIDDIEVVVSDNCSDDGITGDILESFKNNRNIRIYHNDHNLGFNGNIRVLIDNYAKGQYCWIIGDDDYIDIDALSKLLTILKEESPSFVSVKHRMLQCEEYEKLQIDETRIIDYQKGCYFNCLDMNASNGNILGSFMSSQVFLLAPIKAIDKTIFGVNKWEDFRQTFPNSYMMTCAFHDDSNCCAITTPILTALIHSKAWDNQLQKVYMKILPDYYYYCRKLCTDKHALRNTKRIIRDCILIQDIIELKKCHWRNIKWKYVFSPIFVRTLYSILKEKIILNNRRFYSCCYKK